MLSTLILVLLVKGLTWILRNEDKNTDGCNKMLFNYRDVSFKWDLDFQLFVQSIVDPQVDVSSPVSLLLNGWDVGDGSLVDVSHRVGVGVILHQTKVVEPSIVVVWICLDSSRRSGCFTGFSFTQRKLDGPYLDFLLVLEPSLADDDVLDPSPVSKPLLKHGVVLEERLCLLFRDSVQRVFVDHTSTFKL